MNKAMYTDPSVDIELWNGRPNMAQLRWTVIPTYVLALIIAFTGMLWSVLPMAVDLLGADTTSYKSWLVIMLVVDGSMLALLSAASRRKTDSWALPIGPRIDRLLTLHALWAGLPLLCLIMVLFYSVILLSSSASLDWVSSGLLSLVDGDWVPETENKAEWAAMIAFDIWFIVIMPVVTELFFRGYLLHRLIIKCGAVGGIVLTSIVFSLFNYDFVGAFLFSIVLCLMVLYTGSIRWAIIAHASTNAFALLLGYVEYFYPFDQTAEFYSLQYFQNTMWFGVLCGLLVLPWLVWIWGRRQKIKPRIWAAPLIETAGQQAQGFLSYLIGSGKTIAATMSLLVLVWAGQLTYVTLLVPDDGAESMKIDAGQIDPADVERFAKVGMGHPENIRTLADVLCPLDHRASDGDFMNNVKTAIADVLSMPMPSIEVRDLDWALGQFSASSWSISLDTAHLARRSSSKEDRIDLYNTLAHELRHAEQAYAAARYQVSALDYPFLIMFPGYFPDSPLPHSVREQALKNPSFEGDDAFDFGRLMSAVDSNDEIARKRRQAVRALDSWFFLPMSSYYHRIYRDELPSERDAFAIGDKLGKAVEGCRPQNRLLQLENKLADDWTGVRSDRNANKVNVTFRNQTSEVLTVYWIDFEGQRKSYGELAPGRGKRQSTFEGHRWELESKSGELFGRFVATAEDSTADVSSKK